MFYVKRLKCTHASTSIVTGDFFYYHSVRVSLVSINRLYFLQRLLKLTQPTPEWIPAPEKRRLAREGQNDVKMTQIADTLQSSIPPPYNTAVDVNGTLDKSTQHVDNPAYMTDQPNNLTTIH